MKHSKRLKYSSTTNRENKNTVTSTVSAAETLLEIKHPTHIKESKATTPSDDSDVRAMKTTGGPSRTVSGHEGCIPESTSGGTTEDHVAHAVPGVYHPFTDMDDDGFADIEIDGSASHSHFFDFKNGIYGRITSYTWTDMETNQIISNEVNFIHRFAKGVTRIKLTVVDNSCSTHEAQTKITVSGKMKSGQYCYFYHNMSVADRFSTVNETVEIPFAAGRFSSLSVKDTDLQSIIPRSTSFVVKCISELHLREHRTVQNVTIDTNGTGGALLSIGNGYVFSSMNFSEIQLEFEGGMNTIEVTYSYSNYSVANPYLSINVNGSDLGTLYDESTVIPVISAVHPSIVKPEGGTKVHINGFGIIQPYSVYFGNVEAKVSEYFSNNEVSVYAPPMIHEYVNVSVVPYSGRESKKMLLQYSEEACDPVKFEINYIHRKDRLIENGAVTERDRPLASIRLPTCVTLGPDNRLYIGSLGGTLHTIGYEGTTLEANTYCRSLPFRDANFVDINGSLSQFDILGVAFNPNDEGVLPYVSTSALFRSRDRIDKSNTEWWKNGGVQRYKYIANPEEFTLDRKSNDNVCLEHDRSIVRNLPVSGRDHGVNALLFTQDGNLLISVGGFTNMGMPSSDMGGTWESVLSGAVLIANIDVGLDSFEGNITYTSTDIQYATQLSGDVHPYATGIRNAFSMTMTQNGAILAADQGPNCGFGKWASSCSNMSEITSRTSSFDSCLNSEMGMGRPDKILHLEQGSFYGHANVQRGECEWIDPLTGMSPDGNKPPENYKEPLSLTKSSVTGINEYRANHFCGQLQNNLIMTDLQGKKVWNLGPNNEVETLAEGVGVGGIQFVEDMYGNLIFAQLYNSTVNFNVLRPVVSKKEKMKAIGVWPHRVRKSGGSNLFIGGWGFNSRTSVRLGNTTCPVDKENIIATRITCVAPELGNSMDPSSTYDLTLEQDGQKSVIKNAVLYTL